MEMKTKRTVLKKHQKISSRHKQLSPLAKYLQTPSHTTYWDVASDAASLKPEIQKGFDRLKKHHTIPNELGEDELSRVIQILTLCLRYNYGKDYEKILAKKISKSTILEILRDKNSISRQLSRAASAVNRYVIPLLNAFDKKPKPDGKHDRHAKGDGYAHIPDLLKDWAKLVKGLKKADFNYSLLWDARLNFPLYACVHFLSKHFNKVYRRPKFPLVRDILNYVFYNDEHWDTENIRQIAHRAKKLYAVHG